MGRRVALGRRGRLHGEAAATVCHVARARRARGLAFSQAPTRSHSSIGGAAFFWGRQTSPYPRATACAFTTHSARLAAGSCAGGIARSTQVAHTGNGTGGIQSFAPRYVCV